MERGLAQLAVGAEIVVEIIPLVMALGSMKPRLNHRCERV